MEQMVDTLNICYIILLKIQDYSGGEQMGGGSERGGEKVWLHRSFFVVMKQSVSRLVLVT